MVVRKRYLLTGVASLLIATVFVLALVYDQRRARVEDLDLPGYSVPAPLKFEYLDVSFLGDSDTAGVGSGRSAGFEALLSRRFCWASNVSGQRGTGYTTAGEGDRGVYSSRIGAIAATDPELIFIQGGLNDLVSPDLAAAAFDVIESTRLVATDAFVVVIGPAPAPSADFDLVRKANDSIRGAALRSGVAFLDLLAYSWAYDPSSYVPSTVYLSKSGQKLLSDEVATELLNFDSLRFSTCDPV